MRPPSLFELRVGSSPDRCASTNLREILGELPTVDLEQLRAPLSKAFSPTLASALLPCAIAGLDAILGGGLTPRGRYLIEVSAMGYGCMGLTGVYGTPPAPLS
jgi:hypothetical protein